MARYYQHHHHHHHNQKHYKGYSDLRDFLDDKHQHEGESDGRAPEDPSSILKDPLRDDVFQHNRPGRNEFYRGRGRYQRRPAYYVPRGRGQNIPRGHGFRAMPPNPTNIKIEFSTKSGERKCMIEAGNDISDKFNNSNQNRANLGGRAFRGYRRGRGHRGLCSNRRSRDNREQTENAVKNGERSGRRLEAEVKQLVEVEQEENWDLPNNEKQKVFHEGPEDFAEESKALSEAPESFNKQSESSLKENNSDEHNEEKHDCEEDEIYHEEDEIYHEGDEVYHEGDEIYQEGDETYHEDEYFGEEETPYESEVPSKDYVQTSASEISREVKISKEKPEGSNTEVILEKKTTKIPGKDTENSDADKTKAEASKASTKTISDEKNITESEMKDVKVSNTNNISTLNNTSGDKQSMNKSKGNEKHKTTKN